METKVSTRKRTPRTGNSTQAAVSRNKSKNTAGTRPSAAVASPDPLERHRLISEAAYYRAEARGFTPGYEDMDWLEAEREVELAVESD